MVSFTWGGVHLSLAASPFPSSVQTVTHSRQLEEKRKAGQVWSMSTGNKFMTMFILKQQEETYGFCNFFTLFSQERQTVWVRTVSPWHHTSESREENVRHKCNPRDRTKHEPGVNELLSSAQWTTFYWRCLSSFVDTRQDPAIRTLRTCTLRMRVRLAGSLDREGNEWLPWVVRRVTDFLWGKGARSIRKEVI